MFKIVIDFGSKVYKAEKFKKPLMVYHIKISPSDKFLYSLTKY